MGTAANEPVGNGDGANELAGFGERVGRGKPGLTIMPRPARFLGRRGDERSGAARDEGAPARVRSGD